MIESDIQGYFPFAGWDVSFWHSSRDGWGYSAAPKGGQVKAHRVRGFRKRAEAETAAGRYVSEQRAAAEAEGTTR